MEILPTMDPALQVYRGFSEKWVQLPPSLMKRLLTELKAVASGSPSAWMHSGEGIQVFPSEMDSTFWRALIEGPVGTPFEGGPRV